MIDDHDDDGSPGAGAAEPNDVDDIVAAYVDQLNAGDAVAEDEIRVDHPSRAAEILERLSAFVAAGASRPLGNLGDYTLRRQIGRGGMGVVYEAWENSMDRRVALKVLPAGIAADERAVGRFVREAQLAGRLNHPHVVPVYGMGVKEQTPYYAMEFVEGETLARVLAKLRAAEPESETPFGRKDRAEFFGRIAEAFADVADGLQHAHSKKVIHRDIKPSNLILDPEGRLRILDFGLARLEGQGPLTLSGDLVGTPQYMSPEQARRERVAIDHRTDIYSLGATMYETLAGRPPFEGKDHADTLSRIIERDPVEPRRLNPRVPKDLEMIVLQCLRKDPVNRYGTAEAMAQDLRRFVRGDPVEAGVEPAWDKLRRRLWRFRHRLIVTSSLFLALAVAAGAIAWVDRHGAARRVALERDVLEAVEEARISYHRDRLLDAVGALNRAKRLLETDPGHEGLAGPVRQWHVDLDTALRLEEIWLEEAKEKGLVFDWASTEAAYREVFQRYGLDPGTPDPAGAAERIRSSTIRRDLVRGLEGWLLARSVAGTGGQEELLEVLRQADPDRWRNRLREALAHRDTRALVDLARDGSAAGQPPAAIVHLGRALRNLQEVPLSVEILRQAQAEHPRDFILNFALAHSLHVSKEPVKAVGFLRVALALRPSSARTHVFLANVLLEAGEPGEAITLLEKAVTLEPNDAELHSDLGAVLVRMGRLEEATAAVQRAIDIDPAYAPAYFNLGTILFRQGNLPEAVAALRDAVRLEPDHAVHHFALGTTLGELGRLDEAIAELERAIDLEPSSPEAHYNVANAFSSQGMLDEAIASYQRAIHLDAGHYRAHVNLGAGLLARGRVEEAIAAYRQAVEIRPDDPVIRCHLGSGLLRQGRAEDAIAEYRKAIALYKSGGVASSEGAASDAMMRREGIPPGAGEAKARNELAAALVETGRLDEAIDELRQAVVLSPDHAGVHSNLGRALRDSGDFHSALRHLRRGHELGSQDPSWPYPSAEWVADCERLLELDGRLSRFLAGDEANVEPRERLELARVCHLKRRFEEALRLLEGAFAEEPALAEDLNAGHRYNAACAAALASAGEGRDASPLDDGARSRWRRRAIEWLRADLERHRDRQNDAVPAVEETLTHWLHDRDLRALRDEECLSRLPAGEREACVKLWRDVAELLRAARKKEP